MVNHMWEEVETKVLGRVMATVSMREGYNGGPPLYSARVGTVQLLDDGTTRICSHMSIYDMEQAAQLLQELAAKYQMEREQARTGTPGISRRYRQARRS